jgi:hypothetical protein
MDSEELLAQLADIHLPGAVTFWPPAPGWWILAIMLIAGLYWLASKVINRRNLQKICEHALAELERCHREFASDGSSDRNYSKLRYVNAFNSVLRRVALVHFPQANVASLGGNAWVDFIREKGDSSDLNDELAAALSYGRFQTKCEVNVDAMNSLGQSWITSLYLGHAEKQAKQDSGSNLGYGSEGP